MLFVHWTSPGPPRVYLMLGVYAVPCIYLGRLARRLRALKKFARPARVAVDELAVVSKAEVAELMEEQAAFLQRLDVADAHELQRVGYTFSCSSSLLHPLAP